MIMMMMLTIFLLLMPSSSCLCTSLLVRLMINTVVLHLH